MQTGQGAGGQGQGRSRGQGMVASQNQGKGKVGKWMGQGGAAAEHTAPCRLPSMYGRCCYWLLADGGAAGCGVNNIYSYRQG